MSWQSIIKMFSDYNGRLSREAFVVAYGSLLIIRILILALYYFSFFDITHTPEPSFYIQVFFLFIILFFDISAYVVLIKRLRNLNLPGWYLYIAAPIPLLVLLFLFSPEDPFIAFIAFTALLFFLFMFFWISDYVVIIKRFHNLNLPGWYLYIAVLIFLLGLTFLSWMKRDPFLVLLMISWFAALLANNPFIFFLFLIVWWYPLTLLLELLFLPYLILAKGNPKINKYGEPPLLFKDSSFVLFGSYVLVGLYIFLFIYYLVL